MCNIWSRSWEINWNLSSGERQPGRENWLHKAWSYERVWLLRGTERGIQLIRGGERWKEKAATVDLGLYWLGSAGGVGTSKKGKTEPLLRGREKTCKIHKSPARALGCYFLQQWLKKILKMENRESHFSVTELLTFPWHHLTGGGCGRGGPAHTEQPYCTLHTHTSLPHCLVVWTQAFSVIFSVIVWQGYQKQMSVLFFTKMSRACRFWQAVMSLMVPSILWLIILQYTVICHLSRWKKCALKPSDWNCWKWAQYSFILSILWVTLPTKLSLLIILPVEH